MRAFCYIQKKYYKWKIDLIADDLFKGEKKNCEIEIFKVALAAIYKLSDY